MLFMLKDNRLKDSPALEVRTLILGRLELTVKVDTPRGSRGNTSILAPLPCLRNPPSVAWRCRWVTLARLTLGTSGSIDEQQGCCKNRAALQSSAVTGNQ